LLLAVCGPLGNTVKEEMAQIDVVGDRVSDNNYNYLNYRRPDLCTKILVVIAPWSLTELNCSCRGCMIGPGGPPPFSQLYQHT
jgi:hypothetical protein